MDTNDLQDVRLEQEGNANYFVHHGRTGKLIGRVWQEPNGEWWATFYLGQGSTARNVSGGNFDTQRNAVAEVWNQSEDHWGCAQPHRPEVTMPRLKEASGAASRLPITRRKL
jgi:hypothetical protein